MLAGKRVYGTIDWVCVRKGEQPSSLRAKAQLCAGPNGYGTLVRFTAWRRRGMQRAQVGYTMGHTSTASCRLTMGAIDVER